MTDEKVTDWDPVNEDYYKFLETRAERSARRRSLVVIYITTFIFMLGFSIVLTGVAPYLQQIDPTATKPFLGLVVAAYPLGQLLASPLLGWLGNKLGSVRILCVSTMAVYSLGFAIYASLGIFPEPRKYYMLVARFFVGIAAATVTLCFSYVSTATTLRERTTALSIISFSQSIGFILGPVIQSSLYSLGEEGSWDGPGSMTINMYTAAGWIASVLGLANCVLFLPCIFTEFDMAKREAQFLKAQRLAEDEDAVSLSNIKLDKLGLIICMTTFGIVLFNFILIETLATTVTMEQLGWAPDDAVFRVGIMLAIGGVLGGISYLLCGPLARRWNERIVLLTFGFIPLVLGALSYLPAYSSEYPPIKNMSLFTTTLGPEFSTTPVTPPLTILLDSDSQPLAEMFFMSSYGSSGLENGTDRDEGNYGCPSTQDWCFYTHKIEPVQFIVGFLLTSIGYSFALSMSMSNFSKMIGPRPQGTWMGILSACGCISRIVGPIYVTNVYTLYGTWVTFGSIAGILISTALVNLIFYQRLAPVIDHKVKSRNPKY